MKIPSPGFLIQAFAQVLRRFPAAMLCAFIGTIAMVIIVENHENTDEWVRIILTCLLGLPLLTGLVAFSESKGWEEKRALMLQGLGLLAMLGYWFWLDPKAESFEYRVLPGFLSLLLVFHLFVAVAPYLNDRSVRNFWEYNKNLFANFVIGACFTLILNAGLSLAILAVDQLFDLNFDSKIYPRLFFILAGVFNTAYFLSNFPKNYNFDIQDGTFSAIFKNLSKFILIPIVVLYFLILYAYAFKIIGTWSLPRGWVASLVIGFSVAGIFTYLLSYYLPEQDKARHIHAYRRWFWWILLPLTVLLFVAIGRRIDDYGITELRFLVAEMGVWLLLNGLYFALSKKDNIKFIPISLMLFALAYAFGPLSARAVSERNQLNRITRVLKQTDRLLAGKMKPGITAVTETESEQFESAFGFLQQRNRLELLDPMLPMPLDSLPKAVGYHGTSGKLRAWLGMGEKPSKSGDQIQVIVQAPTPIDAVSIEGFKAFKPLALNSGPNISFQKKGDYFQLSKDKKTLEWTNYDGEKVVFTESINLQPIMKSWIDLKPADDSYYELNVKDQLVEFTRKNGTLRIVIESGAVEMGDDGLTMEYLNGYVFIK